MSANIAISADAGSAEFRAAGTDLSERRRSGISRGPLIDLIPSPETVGVQWTDDGAVRIGALTTIAAIAGDSRIASGYPGLAAAAAGLATPQIRHLATLGGNLAQRSRCWYFRNPQTGCLKKDGSTCPARHGNHLYGVAFDLGPCVAPHPSTMAAALLAYEARVTTNMRRDLPVPDVLGDGRNGAADNALQTGEIINSIALPPPQSAERARYKRAISRSHAEWPLVELVVRAIVSDGSFRLVRIAAGGVAPVPLRLFAAEAAARGAAATMATVSKVAETAIDGANPLPQTSYKVELLRNLVRDLLGSMLGSAT
ncbi:MAG: FAD binding domain-containing protein [Bradyrhizobium sp.]